VLEGDACGQIQSSSFLSSLMVTNSLFPNGQKRKERYETGSWRKNTEECAGRLLVFDDAETTGQWHNQEKRKNSQTREERYETASVWPKSQSAYFR